MDNTILTEKERKLTLLLIHYIQKNPDAKHTTGAIARWWIMQQKFEEDIKSVKKAIE